MRPQIRVISQRKCAAREEIATPLGTPFPISYVWKGAVHTYYPDYVGKLIDGRPFFAEAGIAAQQRTPQKLAEADAAHQHSHLPVDGLQSASTATQLPEKLG
jgi:hypothetical protein